MEKKVSAMKARRNLGLLMNEVSIRGDDYIIERAGKPLVAIISMEKYQILQEDRKALQKAQNKIWDKMADVNPEVLDTTINEAVKEVKRI